MRFEYELNIRIHELEYYLLWFLYFSYPCDEWYQ